MGDRLTRRNFIHQAGTGIALGATLGQGAQATERSSGGSLKKRPNFVIIMSDQQRFDTIGALGFEHAITPNIDKLISRGVACTQTIAQGAVCSPSRASVVCGKYVHTHGAFSNGYWIRDDEPNWIAEMRDAGWHTANIGKMHSKPIDDPCGFDYRFVVENKNHIKDRNYDIDDYERVLQKRGLIRPGSNYDTMLSDWREQLGATIWPYEEELYPDNFVGNMSVEYIRNHDFGSMPLFLWSGFAGPHDPYDITRSALDAYGDVPIPDPVTFPGEYETKPPDQKEYMDNIDGSSHVAAIWWSHATPEKIQRLRRHYFANIMLIDEWVGKITNTLKEIGEYDNTIFVFTSDHGDALGDHGIIYKFCSHYDSVCRVPLIFAGPGIKNLGVLDEQVELMDVGPTILSLAGVEAQGNYQSISIADHLTGKARGQIHEATFSEHGRRSMVRTDTWKLVHYTGKPYGELYNLQEDPNELRNLYNDNRLSDIQRDMTTQLLDWYASTKVRT